MSDLSSSEDEDFEVSQGLPLAAAVSAGPAALVAYLVEEVRLQPEEAARAGSALFERFGVRAAADLRFLTERDADRAARRAQLLAVPRRKLLAAWRTEAGLSHGAPSLDCGDAAFIDHARRLLTQV
jgi:hypothetical protein